MLMWFVRREFWDFLAWVKFRFAKPVDITLPPAERWYIEPKPMINAIPQIPLRNVAVCTRADIPKDERLCAIRYFSAPWSGSTPGGPRCSRTCQQSTRTRMWR